MAVRLRNFLVWWPTLGPPLGDFHRAPPTLSPPSSYMSPGAGTPPFFLIFQPPDGSVELPSQDKTCICPHPILLGVLSPRRREVLITVSLGLLNPE